MNEYIKFKGLVSAHQDNKLIFTNVPNKFTTEGMKSIVGWLNMQFHYGNTTNSTLCLPAYSWSIYLGTGGAATTVDMTALATSIGTTPGTVPNTKSIAFKDGTSDGIWDIIFTGTWNTGTITGTVAEMGLYLTKPNAYTYNWSSYGTSVNGGVAMVSRLCTGDSEFEAFTIDNTKPLTIDWKIRFTFG